MSDCTVWRINCTIYRKKTVQFKEGPQYYGGASVCLCWWPQYYHSTIVPSMEACLCDVGHSTIVPWRHICALVAKVPSQYHHITIPAQYHGTIEVRDFGRGTKLGSGGAASLSDMTYVATRSTYFASLHGVSHFVELFLTGKL